MKFGKIVKQLRKQRGLSQEKLAAQAGIHRNFWGSIERGERDVSLSSLLKIAQALEIRPSELLKKF